MGIFKQFKFTRVNAVNPTNGRLQDGTLKFADGTKISRADAQSLTIYDSKNQATGKRIDQ